MAHGEILLRRKHIGELLGQIRDVEAEWNEESRHRLTTENTTLKQRGHRLTADNRTLDERLKAAPLQPALPTPPDGPTSKSSSPTRRQRSERGSVTYC